MILSEEKAKKNDTTDDEQDNERREETEQEQTEGENLMQEKMNEVFRDLKMNVEKKKEEAKLRELKEKEEHEHRLRAIKEEQSIRNAELEEQLSNILKRKIEESLIQSKAASYEKVQEWVDLVQDSFTEWKADVEEIRKQQSDLSFVNCADPVPIYDVPSISWDSESSEYSGTNNFDFLEHNTAIQCFDPTSEDNDADFGNHLVLHGSVDNESVHGKDDETMRVENKALDR